MSHGRESRPFARLMVTVSRSLLIGTLVCLSLAMSLTVGSAQSEDAQVRVVHASPDAPAVDVYVNGDAAIEGLEFGSASDWTMLPAGDYEVQVAPAGTSADDAVIEATLTLESGMAYDVAAIGLLADIEAAVYPVDLSAVGDGKARVRAVHASPDAPAVDVAVTDGPVLFKGAEFPNATDYAEVDAGTYDLEVRPAGTEDVALSVPGVALEAGTVYDVYAIGLLEDESLTLLPLATSATSGETSDSAEEVHQMPSTGVGSAPTTSNPAPVLAAVFALLSLVSVVLVRVTRHAR